MSDIAWTAFYLLILIISAVPVWIPCAIGGICLYIAGLWTWVHVSRVRERRQGLAAMYAADGTWWPVDLEAQDALYAHLDAAEAIDDGLDRMLTRLGPPDGYEPAPGSDPWLRDLWPDAPEWEDAA